MKSILRFFFLVSVALGAGIYFYETQIASPNAADTLVKSKKKRIKPAAVKAPPVIKKSSLSVTKTEDIMAAYVKPSRVIDLVSIKDVGGKGSTKRKNKQREIERSIRSTIKKTISLDIQKAVVTEISKKR